jgi:hypothetical protein
LLEFVDDNGLQQGLLAWEVMIDQAFSDTGPSGDFPVGGLEVAFIGKTGHGRIKNLPLPLGTTIPALTRHVVANIFFTGCLLLLGPFLQHA